MKVLETPSSSFDQLPGYSFDANFMTLGDGLRLHYLDEGDKDGWVVLLLHGEPSWSYLYRKMIPPLVEQGFRVLVPDLIGFGKSSKPASPGDYSYAKHIGWIRSWLFSLDLKGINLFCQDWGGLIGLRLVTGYPERFDRIAVANTGLPTGDHDMPEAFMAWREYSKRVETLPVAKIIQSSTTSELSKDILDAYEAPFPDPALQAGAKIFPSLVPVNPDDIESENNRKAWEVLRNLKKPFLTLFSDQDPITRGGEKVFLKLVPGAQHDLHQTIRGAGHFLQEDKGEEIAQILADFIRNT